LTFISLKCTLYSVPFNEMRAKQRLKKTGDNEYTRATGNRAYTLKGGSNCVVSAIDSVYSNKYKVQPHAYYIFNHKDIDLPFNPHIKITTTCGATNCVNRDHLIATYKPSKEDREYLKDWYKPANHDDMAQKLSVLPSLLSQYLASNPL
jgi:hypothetical protein